MGRHRAGVPLVPVYTVETAAAELGLDADELYAMCLADEVIHADLGAGEDDKGGYHDHLIRFTPAMIEEIRAGLPGGGR